MEMMDMGKKSEMGPQPVEGKSKEVKMSYPSFGMTGDKIPTEIENAKVGDMCRCEIIIKKVGDSIDTYGKGEKRVEVEIHKLGYVGKSGKLTKEEYMGKTDEEKDKYDEEQVKADAEEEAESVTAPEDEEK